MQSLHAAAAVDVAFDDPNLVTEHVKIVDAENAAGANPAAKVMSLVAGMAAGADSIEDIDRLRQRGNRHVFDQMRAPSTVGHVPAGVHPRARAAAEHGAAPDADRAGPAGESAARRRAGGVRGPGLHPPAGVRVRQGGRANTGG